LQNPDFKYCLPALLGVLISHAGLVHAQQPQANEAPVVIDSGIFDSSVFDNLFGDSNLFSNGSLSSNNFRFRLSHQISGHINRHTTEAPDGSKFQRARGVENNRVGLNVRYQNPFASGWLLQGSGQIRAWLPGDYEYDNPGRDDAEWRLNELFVQRSGSRHSFSFGRQTIVWGETVGNSVLDVINTTEYRDLSIIDIEDARLNQWLLVWDLFGDQGNLSSFVNLYPEFDPVPVTGSPLFPRRAEVNGQPLRLGYHHRSKPLFEIGTRWHKSYTGSDVAFMAARLYENPIRYTLPELSAAGLNAVSNINDYDLLGVSVNRAIGRLLLTLDVAWSRGVLVDSINNLDLPGGGSIPVPGFEKQNRLGMSAGMEYGITPTQQISLSVAAQREQAVGADTRGNILMRYSNNLRNDELVLSATMQSQLDGEAILLFLAADYRLTDDWEISGQLVLTRADAHTLLYFLNQDVRAGLTITWNF
jgi:hypothetical protein